MLDNDKHEACLSRNLPLYVVYYDVDICATMNHVLFWSLGYCDYRTITMGFHPEALTMLELHPGPPQHTQEDLGDPSHICLP